MNRPRSSPGFAPPVRHLFPGVVAAIACLGLCAGAWAARPVSGATYSGTIKETFKHSKTISRFPISFKVTKSGKRVGSFTLASGFPIYCQGGGLGNVSGGSGAVSKSGDFKVKLPIIFAPTHQHQGFVTITGSFKAHKRESGRVTTSLTKFAICNGSSPYSTATK